MGNGHVRRAREYRSICHARLGKQLKAGSGKSSTKYLHAIHECGLVEDFLDRSVFLKKNISINKVVHFLAISSFSALIFQFHWRARKTKEGSLFLVPSHQCQWMGCYHTLQMQYSWATQNASISHFVVLFRSFWSVREHGESRDCENAA